MRLLRNWYLPGGSFAENRSNNFVSVYPAGNFGSLKQEWGKTLPGRRSKWALAQSRPDLLLFAGFCGGLNTELHIGDVCIVEKTIAFRTSRDECEGILTFRFPDELRTFLTERNVRSISAVTIGSPEDKSTLAEHVSGLAGVDMETYTLAAIARREQLPFLCFRSVSDDLNSKLNFDLGDITGPGGKVKVGKVAEDDRPSSPDTLGILPRVAKIG